MTQPSLFDAIATPRPESRWSKSDVCANRHGGQQLKRRGMEKAAAKHKDSLLDAQLAASFLGAMRGNTGITIEDVRTYYELQFRPWDLGNAAGSVFKGPEWEAVGYQAANRPEAHARILRVWRLKR